MQIFAISRGGFEGVGEGMTEIKDFAEPGFTFIAAHDFSLGLDASRDHEIERLGVAPGERRDRVFEKRKQALVADDAVFDYFVQSRTKLAIGQRRERRWVSQHEL